MLQITSLLLALLFTSTFATPVVSKHKSGTLVTVQISKTLEFTPFFDGCANNAALAPNIEAALAGFYTRPWTELARGQVLDICTQDTAAMELVQKYVPLNVSFPGGKTTSVIAKAIVTNKGCQASSKTDSLQLIVHVYDVPTDSEGPKLLKALVVCRQSKQTCRVDLIEDLSTKGMCEKTLSERGLERRDCCPNCAWCYSDCVRCLYKNCFPAKAKVVTQRGTISMHELNVGDKIKVLVGSKEEWSDVYMFGHRDAETFGDFVLLSFHGSNETLTLTGDHYIPVKRFNMEITLAAKDVMMGDSVYVLKPFPAWRPVVKLDVVQEHGMFNPYTLSGSIIVDNVHVSCHSSSFLDGVFSYFGVNIAKGYQVAFTPIRMLYRISSFKNWIILSSMIDNVADSINTPL
jgi:hypothetical protein